MTVSARKSSASALRACEPTRDHLGQKHRPVDADHCPEHTPITRVHTVENRHTVGAATCDHNSRVPLGNIRLRRQYKRWRLTASEGLMLATMIAHRCSLRQQRAIAENWWRRESGRRHIVGVLDASTSPNVDDQLTGILRNGARALPAQAVEAEVADFLGKHADLKTEDGHQRVVRHDHLPEREVMTGIGPVAVRQPRVRDREATTADPDRIRFSPSILQSYMRRSKSIETLSPILSEGDLDRRLLRGTGGAARAL